MTKRNCMPTTGPLYLIAVGSDYEESETKSNPGVIIGCIGATILCLTAATGALMYKNMKPQRTVDESIEA